MLSRTTDKRKQSFARCTANWAKFAPLMTDRNKFSSTPTYADIKVKMEAEFKPSELQELKGHFAAFDLDGNGSITGEELDQVLKRLGEKITPAATRELIASVDKDGNGTIEWDEFLAMIKQIRAGKNSGFGTIYKRAAKILTVQGSSSSIQHSFTEEEKEAFVDHINVVLAGDKHIKALPINPQSMDVFKAVGDGVLLCKLINKAAPGTIDERVINTKEKKNAWEINENHTLALQSAKGIGCSVVNVGPSDLNEGKVHLVLGLLWQIIKIGLLSTVNIVHRPELVRLLAPGEELSDLLKLTPEQLLIRWVNFHLNEAGSSRRIANFSGDIKDSEAYTILLSQICPNRECDKSPLSEVDFEKRAEAMLIRADRIGCRKFVGPKDVIKGNAKLNLAFVANLFNTFPALAALTQSDEAQFADLLNFDSEGTREERAFRFWIQSLGLDCNNLFEDMCDGILMLKVLDKVSPGIVDWKKVNMEPKNKFKKVENCNYAVVLCKMSQLKFSLVGIGGQDIHDKNKKLILAIVWQIMRFNILQMLKGLSRGGKEMTDADLVKWANEKVASSGKHTSISSFKDASLKTGHFLIDLCYAISNRSVNYELVLPGTTDHECEQNAKLAISVARKIGSVLFLVWEDIRDCNAKMILSFVGGLAAVEGHGVASGGAASSSS